MSFKSILLILFLAIPFLGLTQKDMYEKGRIYYEAQQYEKALEYFYADKFGNNNKELLIRRVISNYETGQIESAKKDVSILLAIENYPPETFFMIGKIYHSEGNYKKAAENYKNYLRLNSKAKNKPEVIHLIKQCGQARKLKYIESDAFVDNYGKEINTKYDEFRMIQSPNFPNKYYFSSAREGANGGRRNEKGKRDDTFGAFNSDMYTVEMSNGEWLPSRAINPFINTSRDEVALDFSSDGTVLFYMKGVSYEQGTIFTDTFTVDKKDVLTPSPLDAPIYAEKGDTWLHLFNNSTILFASNRDGGYGGYDLYITYKVDGKWSKPKNLGSGVNSKYDEISPAISKDGKTLFFSTNRIESFGGYDIFRSDYNEIEGLWSTAKNMGNPVNSAGDEMGFYLSHDGNSAFLSSDRKSGFGGFDLYVVYFKNQIKGQLNKAATLAFVRDDSFVPFTSTTRASKPTSSKASTSSPKKKETEELTKNTKPKKPKKKKSKRPKKKKRSKKKKKSKKENTAKSKEASFGSETISEYVINPVFYEPGKEILNAASRKEIDIVLELMSTYEKLTLDIEAHTVQDGMEAVDLYFSIKRAEQIGNYLVENGIDPKRIYLKGYGSNYPIAKPETGGTPSKIGSRVNSRIEFDIKNSRNLPIKITIVEPYLVDYLRDPRGELFKTVEDGLSYRVQIASVGQMYQNQVLLLYNDSMIEKRIDQKNFRYTLGLYESFKDAEELVKDLENYSITGAFIVPYINGKRIEKGEFSIYTSQYPDLLKFINR